VAVYDVLIKNAKIIDGSGTPWFRADIGIAGGKIVRIGRGLSEGKVMIEANDRIVSPGFIDAHTHSDYTLLADPMAQSKIRQGITTEVIGNCGSAPAPLVGNAPKQVKRTENVNVTWTSIGGYLDRLEAQGVAVNVVPLCGFASARISVMGHSERPATAEERQQMRKLIEQNIDEGAFGMSNGLFYAPQSFAPTDEVIDVVKGLKPKEALYVTHIRDHSDYTIGFFAALEEAYKIASEAQVTMHISHVILQGIAIKGKGAQAVESIQGARDRGLDVTGDWYPYARSGGGITGSLIPRWALAGGRPKTLELIADKATRDKIAQEVAANIKRRGGPEIHTIATHAANPDLEGKRLDEIARLFGEPPEYAILTMLEKGDAGFVSAMSDEGDVATIGKQPWIMIGSDGSSLNLSGPVSGGKRPHPRNFGCFPRFLGLYTRDMGLVPLHEAIRKMTSFPAMRFELKGRGLLREGFWADVTIFDAERIKDNSTFEVPHQFPEGIDYVLVNGEIVIDNGRHTGRLPGKPLRRA
jgi:N-acyl-D-amino-acid deacylase